MTQCEEPMYIDKVDSIIGATGSQIFVSLDQQSFYYGLTADEQDWSSDQERHSLPWNSHRSLIGADELLSTLDQNGHLYSGVEGVRRMNPPWRDVAIDITGRVVAITSSYE